MTRWDWFFPLLSLSRVREMHLAERSLHKVAVRTCSARVIHRIIHVFSSNSSSCLTLSLTNPRSPAHQSTESATPFKRLKELDGLTLTKLQSS